MSTNEKTNSILNDLIVINNDRVKGFEKAIADIADVNLDLKTLFQSFISQSKDYAADLSAVVVSTGGNPEDGTSIGSNLHRTWIDVKAIFGGTDRKSILEEAERGEDAIIKAYKDAMENIDLSPEVSTKIAEQAQGIQDAHHKIKALRDLA